MVNGRFCKRSAFRHSRVWREPSLGYFFVYWQMGDKVKSLRKENDDFRRQLEDLKNELSLSRLRRRNRKNIMKRQQLLYRIRLQHVQFLSDSYDALILSQNLACQNLYGNFSRRLDLLTVNVDRTDKATSHRTATNITLRSWAFHKYLNMNLHKTPRYCVWSYFPV